MRRSLRLLKIPFDEDFRNPFPIGIIQIRDDAYEIRIKNGRADVARHYHCEIAVC